MDQRFPRAGGASPCARFSATKPPPRTVAPNTIAALMSTAFLMMLLPLQRRRVGIRVKTSLGTVQRIRVPASATASRRSTARMKIPKRSPTPIRQSMLQQGIETPAVVTSPKLSVSMVVRQSCAGLRRERT